MKLELRVVSHNFQGNGRTSVQATSVANEIPAIESELPRQANLNVVMDSDEAAKLPVGAILDVDAKVIPASLVKPPTEKRAEIARP